VAGRGGWWSTRSPGTTRDPVDETVALGGEDLAFRRHGRDPAARSRRPRGADFYASLRTQARLEKAEVAVVLLDAASR
jgi:GTP-binding protein